MIYLFIYIILPLMIPILIEYILMICIYRKYTGHSLSNRKLAMRKVRIFAVVFNLIYIIVFAIICYFIFEVVVLGVIGVLCTLIVGFLFEPITWNATAEEIRFMDKDYLEVMRVYRQGLEEHDKNVNEWFDNLAKKKEEQRKLRESRKKEITK